MSLLSIGKAFLISLLTVLAVSTTAQGFRNVKEGQPAPGFTLPDLSGKQVTFSGSSGKVAVVTFFKPDQDNSKKSLVELQKIHEKYSPKGVVVIAITSEPNVRAQVSELVASGKITFPVLLDEGRKVYGEWGVFLYPTTGIIDKQGKLLVHVPSHNRMFAETVEANVRLALGEITPEQLKAELNPTEKPELTAEQKKAERHMLLGQRMVDRKLLDKAAEEFAQAVQSDPNLVEAHVKYGFVLLKLGDAAKAQENFKKALELDQKAEDAGAGLGATYVALGEVDKGIEVLTDALKLNTKPARTHFELGKAYEKKGVHDKAAEHYRKAAEELGGPTW